MAKAEESRSTGIIEGATGDWEMVIGIEIHAQVTSAGKLFSGAATEFGAAPNTQVSLVDAAMPGMLPVINERCIDAAILTGLGLNSEVNTYSVFDRKNYFYPDLPQGYQISQYLQPIVGKGEIRIDLEDGTSRDIGITRLHLEQDAGKSLHDQDPDHTYVDLNRSGVALMEIVSEPDIRSGDEAAAYIRKVRSIVRYLGTCDGNMEEGSLRADINVSMRREGEPYGTRCEMKNINSIRFIQQAIAYEARRQVDVLEDGGKVKQETRLYDSVKGETRAMRSKEEADDYRYFPDPDLLPLTFPQSRIDELRKQLPELPDVKKKRYMEELGLSAYDAGLLVAERDRALYFEELAEAHDPKISANWVMGELSAALNSTGLSYLDSPVTSSNLGKLLELIVDGTISNRIAKDVFEIMVATGDPPDRIIEEKGLTQVSDASEIEAHIERILAENADNVAQYKSGKTKIFGFFVGQVMKATGGKANPKVVNELLRARLDG